MGLFDTIFGGSKTNSSQNSGIEALPQYAQDAFQQLVTRGSDLSNNQGLFNNPLNSVQQSALAGLANGPQGLGFTKGAQGAFGNASNVLGQIPGQINMGNGYLNNASGNINAGTNPLSSSDISSSINDFMNPYTQAALAPQLAAIQRQGDTTASNISGLASNAGAYGGTRQALLEAENNRNTNQQLADTTAQGYNQNYTNASNLGLNRLQTERNNFLTGAGLNVNQGNSAYNGANSLATAGNAYSNLGNANLAGWTTNVNNSAAVQNNALNAGNQIQQNTLQQQQIPIQQLSLLQSILSGLPSTSQGASNGNVTGGVIAPITKLFGFSSGAPAAGGAGG